MSFIYVSYLLSVPPVPTTNQKWGHVPLCALWLRRLIPGSVRLSVPCRIGTLAACSLATRPPEMCGLRTRPRTDVDPPRVELPSLCIYMNGQACVVFNRNCFPKMKDYSTLRPYKSSHLQRNCGSRPIKEMVQDRDVVTTHH